MKIYSGTQAAYDAGIISNDRSWSARLYYFYNNSWSNSLQTSLLKSFTLSDYSTDGSNISMGCVLGGKLTVNLTGVPSSTINRLSDGTQIKIRLTLTSANVTLTSKAFVIDNKKLTKRRNGTYDVIVTAFDVSYLMTHKYTTSLTEPTCLDIVGEIAAKYGLTVNSSVAEAVAAVDGSTPRKYTPSADFICKQTLGYMAGCYGCFAYINEDSEICFGWYTDSGNTIARNLVYEGGLNVSEMEERTIVMLESGTQSNPIVAPDSASGFSINFENPYITQEQATAIYNAKIADGAVSYRIGKVHYKGNPLNSPGKIVTVRDVQNQSATFYIMKRTLRYDGGLSETIECQGESETTINYKTTSPTQQRIERALRKMEDAIKAATDAITQTKGSIFEFIPVDENDLSQGNAGYKLHYKDTGTSAFDDCVIMATAGGIGFSTNNGESFDGLAMYFYEDEAGEIHGCINGEVIRAGSISADKIDTSRLVVSMGNIDGLDDELDSLLADVETANSNASSAQSMANAAALTANSAYTNANTANSNASSALEKANSAINSMSALSTTQQKIIGICLTNDMTYINGSNIATGSILADSIAANQITADKLSVGTGIALNQFYNDEFYDGDRGWYSYGGGLYSQYPNTSYAFMQLYPSGSGMSIIMQKVWLVKGQRYSVAAQIYPEKWNQNASTVYIEPFYGESKTLVGQDLSAAYLYNGETVVKMVFDYPGETGFVDAGIAFRGIMQTATTASNINIAWMSFSDAPNETIGFYCTRKEWLADGYKDSNYLGGSVNNNTTADAYLTQKALTIDANGNLVTLGTIKSNNGEIGSMVYSRERMDIVTHSYYKYFGLPTFASSRISFINPLEYYEFTATSPSYKNSAEEGQRLSARIEVASSARIKTDSGEITGDEYTMITSSGVSVSDSSGHSSITSNGIDIDGVSLTKSDLTALKKLIQ